MFKLNQSWVNNLLCPSSWLDRIPFLVLFGIATSVELFYERLPRAATRCLHGSQFEVEQTNKTLEKVFENVVARDDAPLLLGPGFVAALIERQNDHAQIMQAFVSALKVRDSLYVEDAFLILLVCLHGSLLRKPVEHSFESYRDAQ
jgi:hypothetical protein